MTKFKFLFTILVVSLFLGSIFASENKQFIVSIDEENQIIDAITLLYIQSNYALPSMSAPYSVSELELILKQVDYDSLNKIGKSKFNYVKSILDSYTKEVEDLVSSNINYNISLESYSHSNTEDFLGRENWFRGWVDQKDFINLGVNLFADDLFYGFTDISFGSSRVNRIPFGSSSFQLNIPGTFDLDFARDSESNMPHRAFISLGGNFWNVQIGRDRLNWGAGISGNLMLSDNLKYQDFAKFTAFGNNFKYTYLVSVFPHQLNYIKTEGFDLNTSQYQALSGISLFVAHRFEGRLFNNRLGWSISEGLMYASEDSYLDFRIFNPMLTYHSLFTKSNTNSIISLDLDFTLNYTTNIYTQVVIDDLVIPFVETSDSVHSPNATGILFGVRKDLSTMNISLLSSFEVAYTTPYLYLRDKGDTNSIQDGYGINFIVANREFSNIGGNGIIYDKQFLGYKYGGDALVFNFNNRYTSNNNKLVLELNIFAMLHGTFDIDTPWSPVGGEIEDPGFLSLVNWDNSKTGLYLMSVIGVYSHYEISKNISIFTQLDYVFLYNRNNLGQNNIDFQFTNGLRVKI